MKILFNSPEQSKYMTILITSVGGDVEKCLALEAGIARYAQLNESFILSDFELRIRRRRSPPITITIPRL